MLKEHGVEPLRVEKFSYIDCDGRYYVPGAKIELDIYIHNQKITLIEVKSLAEAEDVDRFYFKCNIAEKILGKKADRKLILAIHITREASNEPKN